MVPTIAPIEMAICVLFAISLDILTTKAVSEIQSIEEEAVVCPRILEQKSFTPKFFPKTEMIPHRAQWFPSKTKVTSPMLKENDAVLEAICRPTVKIIFRLGLKPADFWQLIDEDETHSVTASPVVPTDPEDVKLTVPYPKPRKVKLTLPVAASFGDNRLEIEHGSYETPMVLVPTCRPPVISNFKLPPMPINGEI